MYGKISLLLICLISTMSQANGSPFSKPAEFSFGASLDEVKNSIEPLCRSLHVEKIVPITAALAKDSQEQINCSGFVYGGKERHVELVFFDNRLDIVWILFPENERSVFLDGFDEIYGEPSLVVEYGAIYLQANAAIRNNPPEVLFASKRQVKVMMNRLKEQQERKSHQ